MIFEQVFGSRAKMAKEGLQLLMNETNMSVQMIDDMSDWLFLLSLCDPYVKDGGMRIGTEVIQEPKVTNEMLTMRLKGDEFFNNFLLQLNETKE